jgi:hypothetical protein
LQSSISQIHFSFIQPALNIQKIQPTYTPFTHTQNCSPSLLKEESHSFNKSGFAKQKSSISSPIASKLDGHLPRLQPQESGSPKVSPKSHHKLNEFNFVSYKLNPISNR